MGERLLKSPSERFVITGMDAISPLGRSLRKSWDQALIGVSPIAEIDPSYGDFTNFTTRIAGQVKEYEDSPNFDRKQNRKAHRVARFAMDATVGAIKDSGYHLVETSTEFGPRMMIQEIEPEQWGICVGACVGGVSIVDEIGHTIRTRGPDRVEPIGPLHFLLDRVPGASSIGLTARGPIFAPEGACATGALSIITACQIIRDGLVDMMVAGGSDAAITTIGVAAFGNARALSRRNDEPERASRPFDKDADGFVMGEGAAALVIETLEHALARGTRIYAEIAGYGWTSDAYHETAPSGKGSARAMRQALSRARMDPSEIQYLNAHATSTPLGDKGEAASIAEVFGRNSTSANVGSTKSMTGHMLGAAGAIEAAFSVMAVYEDTIPPNVNLENTEIDLNLVGNKPIYTPVYAASSNSFGFDGINTNLIFIKYAA